MRRLKLLLLSLSCLGATGCASIIHGTKQELSVSTNPAEATVSDGQTTVRTPGKLTLSRDRDHVLTISKPGYETESVRVVHVISGAVAGNILAGGFIGWGVDAISGAQWRLEPETITVSLRPTREGEKIDESLRPTPENLETKLAELDRLKEKKLITEDEYKSMRDIAVRAATSKEALS
jgi:hypothetical protein